MEPWEQDVRCPSQPSIKCFSHKKWQRRHSLHCLRFWFFFLSPASSVFPTPPTTRTAFICRHVFTFDLKRGFAFSYTPHQCNHVHMLLFDRPKCDHKEHMILKMLKTYRSDIILCSAVHLRVLQFSENVFGKRHSFSFIKRQTGRAKWLASRCNVSRAVPRS